MDTLEIKKLVSQLKKGDVNAFDRLFKEYSDKVYNFCRRLLNKESDAEDVTQEVFIALWNNREKIDPDASISAYISGIARNQIFSVYRKRYYSQRYLLHLSHTGTKNESVTEDTINYRQLNELFQKHLEKLPPKRREIFKLSRIDGLSYKDIAQKLDISENTVDVQIRKALDYFREKFLNYSAM